MKKKRLIITIGGIFLVQLLVFAGPTWWASQGLDPVEMDDTTENTSAASIGQALYMAKAAKLQMDADWTSSGGAGSNIDALVATFTNVSSGDLKTGISIGQLKSISKPFYDRLLELNLITTLPDWLTDPALNTNAENHSLASIGQVKQVFDFEMPDIYIDNDGDGWTDIYERYRGTNPYDSDTDKDGIIDSDDDHALVPVDASDVLWWDDQLPEGAIFQGEQWAWADYGYVEPEPVNGIRAVELENNYSYFSLDSANGFQIDEGDVLVNYLYVYSGEEASENDHEAGQRVFVEYFVSDGTSVKLYWGDAYSDGEYTEFRHMGSLPDTGIWTRLEVSASVLGMEGKSLTGMYIESEGGRVLWDYSGKEQHPILYDTATLSETYVRAGEKVYLLSDNSIFIEDKDIEVTLKLQGLCDDGGGGSTPCYIGSPVSLPAIVINSKRVLVTIPPNFESATYDVSAQQEYSYISIADVLNVYRVLSENGKMLTLCPI